jgi:hypothetical protein
MAGELAVPVPHRAPRARRPARLGRSIARRRGLVALKATQRDRHDPASLAGPNRDRHDSDRGTPLLELLTHCVPQQLASSTPESSCMRSGGFTTRRRPAHVARLCLAGRARPHPPAPCRGHARHRSRTLSGRVLLPTASARRCPTERAPLIQPCAAVAHRSLVRGLLKPRFRRPPRASSDPNAPRMHPKPNGQELS